MSTEKLCLPMVGKASLEKMYKQKKLINRSGYLVAFFLLLAVEICIGLFVRDNFVRPYVGDLLVTVLLCCLCRAAFPLSKCAPTAVFLFASVAEGLQWLELTQKLGLNGTFLEVILGATFDWRDILCYALGCIVFAAGEHLIFKFQEKRASDS